MPKLKIPATDIPAIDPRSAEVILAYVDDQGRSARNAPTRDLTHNDVARLAYCEALAEVANDVGQPRDRMNPDGPKYERPDHNVVDQARAAEIYTALVDSGHFTPAIPASVPEPAPASAPTPDPIPEPAAPAEPEA